MHGWRRTVRTIFAVLVALAAIAPLIYRAAALAEPEDATGWLAAVLGVAAAITRVMALPAVEAFLQRFAPWLAAEAGSESDPAPRRAIEE